jgi:hypothetical protein
VESMIVALTPHAAFRVPLVVPSAVVAIVVAIFSDKVAVSEETLFVCSTRTRPGGQRGLPGFCMASGRGDKHVFLSLRTIEGE